MGYIILMGNIIARYLVILDRQVNGKENI